MEGNALICPSCSGQMMLTEAKPGDKIAKCEYCHTIVDLPDEAKAQGFNLNDFFKGFNLDGFNQGTTTTTTTTTTVVIKDEKDMSPEEKEAYDKKMERIKDKLRNSKLSLDDFNDL